MSRSVVVSVAEAQLRELGVAYNMAQGIVLCITESA